MINAALGMFDIESLRRLRASAPEFRLSIATCRSDHDRGAPGVVVAVGWRDPARGPGVAPERRVLGRIPGVDGFHDVRTSLGGHLPGLIYGFDSALVFSTPTTSSRVCETWSRRRRHRSDAVLLDAGSMPAIDTTGTATLDEVRGELAGRGIGLAVAGAKAPLRLMLDRTGVAQQIGTERLFPTVESAVAMLAESGS